MNAKSFFTSLFIRLGAYAVIAYGVYQVGKRVLK